MTDENPVPHERIAPGEYVTAPARLTAPCGRRSPSPRHSLRSCLAHLDGDWDGVGRRAVATLLDAALADLQNEAELTADDVRRGEAVTIDHVARLRRTLDAVEYAIEAHLAALAALAAPFSRRSRIPRHSLRSCLADDAEPWEIDVNDGTDYERPRFTQVRCDCYSDDYYSRDYNDSDSARAVPAAGVREAGRGGGE